MSEAEYPGLPFLKPERQPLNSGHSLVKGLKQIGHKLIAALIQYRTPNVHIFISNFFNVRCSLASMKMLYIKG